ncbi:MAG: hypothetical protein OEY58_02855 [Gammaproteobacteria bacterium]|nr:hypothetical protein [Gammaproteobacteria bacterium]
MTIVQFKTEYEQMKDGIRQTLQDMLSPLSPDVSGKILDDAMITFDKFCPYMTRYNLNGPEGLTQEQSDSVQSMLQGFADEVHRYYSTEMTKLLAQNVKLKLQIELDRQVEPVK